MRQEALRTARMKSSVETQIRNLRAALEVCLGKGPNHEYEGLCPDAQQPDSLDPLCPACRVILAALREEDDQ
jgi:hypothetical protein